MVFNSCNPRESAIKETCAKLSEREREALIERRGGPLFKAPMDEIRAIRERYRLTWGELLAVSKAL